MNRNRWSPSRNCKIREKHVDNDIVDTVPNQCPILIFRQELYMIPFTIDIKVLLHAFGHIEYIGSIIITLKHEKS